MYFEFGTLVHDAAMRGQRLSNVRLTRLVLPRGAYGRLGEKTMALAALYNALVRYTVYSALHSNAWAIAVKPQTDMIGLTQGGDRGRGDARLL